MNDYRVALAIGRAIRSNATFAGVFIYAHDREIDANSDDVAITEVKLPHVGIQVSCEALASSPTVAKCKVEIVVASQGDDETAATHAARCAALRTVMASGGDLTAAFAATGSIRLLGKCALVGNAPDVVGRAFWTPHTYICGAEPI